MKPKWLKINPLGSKGEKIKKQFPWLLKHYSLMERNQKSLSKYFFLILADVFSTAFPKKYKVIHCKRQVMSNRLLLFLLYNLEKKERKKESLLTCILYILEQACSQVIWGMLSFWGLIPFRRKTSGVCTFRYQCLYTALFSQVLPQKLLEKN